MAFEIEHKYLCKDNSFKLMAHYSACVRQGYLSRDKERVVRIRIKGEHGYITVKGPHRVRIHDSDRRCRENAGNL